MTTETPAARTESPAPATRRRHSASLVLLLLCTAGGIYVGMRWHTTFERWLVPSAGGDSAAASTSQETSKPADGKKQLWTCGMHPQVIQDHPGDCPICHMKLTPLVTGNDAGESSSGAGAPGAVVIDPAVVQNMGVRTAEVTEGPLSQTVRVSAMINEAEPGHRDVNLRVSGWIQTLYANTDGMEVKKGDPLFDLYSPELRLAIEELISARRAAKSAGDAANVALGDTGESLVAAAESRLLALDLTPEQVSELGAMEHAPSVVTFVSPFNGHITEKMGVYAGSSVTAGQRVFRLAQRTTMWVEAQVPEGDLGRVHVGQKARARVDAYPGRVFEGEVIFIHPHFDEMTRTAMVRMALPNHEYALHEGMYATVEIDVGDGEQAVLAPREAVIDTGESQLVFVNTGKGRFEPRAVVMGRRGENGLVQILSGLKPGERVVASGQFLLDSESRLREAIAKFLGQGPTKEPQAGDSSPKAVTPPMPTIPLSAAAQRRVDAMVSAYLVLAESLGAVQKDETPLKPDDLVAAVHALHGEVSGPEATRLVSEAASAAESLKGQSIDKQRETFKAVSAKVIAVVNAMPPSQRMADSLYIVNCPMAKADWLQRKTDVENPYYADDMKECGKVVRRVGGAKGAE